MNARVRLALALAAALLAAAAPAAAAPLAGRYVLHHIEMASEIRLDPDGRFVYAMSYGALDEAGEGRWRQAGGAVLLTSDPAIVPAKFVLLSRGRDAAHDLRVRVTDPAGKPVDHVDVAMEFDDGDLEIDATGGDGLFVLPAGGPRRIVKATVGLAMYDLAGDSLTITPADNDLAFRFDANDLGKAEFKDERLEPVPRGYRLTRFGEGLVYERAAPQ